MSYKLVLIEANGHECGNACRFETEDEANGSWYELSGRWMGCPQRYRVEASDSPVNYAMIDGQLKARRNDVDVQSAFDLILARMEKSKRDEVRHKLEIEELSHKLL